MNPDLEKTEELLVPEKKPKTKFIFIGITILLIVCLVAFAVYYFFFRKKTVISYTFNKLVTVGDSVYATDMTNSYSITKTSNNSDEKEVIYIDGKGADLYTLYSDNDNLYFTSRINSDIFINSLNLSNNEYREIAKINDTDIAGFYDANYVNGSFYYLFYEPVDANNNYNFYVGSVDLDGNKKILKTIPTNIDDDDNIGLTTDGKQLYCIYNNQLVSMDFNGENEKTLNSLSDYSDYAQVIDYYRENLYLYIFDYESKTIIANYRINDGNLEILFNENIDDESLNGFVGDNIILSTFDINQYGLTNQSLSFEIKAFNTITRSQIDLNKITITASDAKMPNASYGYISTAIWSNDKIYYSVFIEDWQDEQAANFWYRSNLDGTELEQVSQYNY